MSGDPRVRGNNGNNGNTTGIPEQTELNRALSNESAKVEGRGEGC